MTNSTQPIEIGIGRSPLSIVHLMAWTLGSASVLFFFNVRYNLFSNYGFDTQLRTVLHLTNVMESIVSGAGIAFLGLWGYRKIRNEASLLTEPGHWMLMTSGVVALLPMIDYGIRHGTRLVYSGSLWTIGLRIVTTAAIVILSCMALRTKRCVRFWTTFFILKIATACYAAVALVLVRFIPWMQSAMASSVVHLSPFILLFCGIIDDYRTKTRRDWLHVAGLLVTIAAVAIDAVVGIAILLLA